MIPGKIDAAHVHKEYKINDDAVEAVVFQRCTGMPPLYAPSKK